MSAKLSLAYPADVQAQLGADSPPISGGVNDDLARVRDIAATPNSVAATAAEAVTSASMAQAKEYPTRAEFTADPAFVRPAIASPQQIQHARELRERIRQKYLNRESPPCALWGVGVD